MEIKGRVLSWHETIRLRSFQRRSAHLRLKKVLGLAKSCVKTEGGGEAELEAAPGLVGWMPLTISVTNCSRKYSQRMS